MKQMFAVLILLLTPSLTMAATPSRKSPVSDSSAENAGWATNKTLIAHRLAHNLLFLNTISYRRFAE